MFVFSIGVGLTAGLLHTRPAFAYLDGASVSMLLQAIIGVTAGATVTLGIYWRKLRNVLLRRRSDPLDAPPARRSTQPDK
jgi:hypothetical protein